MAVRCGKCVTRRPDLQWQAWSASIAVHAALVALVLAAPLAPIIDATEPFHWDVRLVEKNVAADQTVDEGSGSRVAPVKPSRELPDKLMAQPRTSVRAVDRPNVQTRQPAEAVRPIHRQNQDRKVVHREEFRLQEVLSSEPHEVIESLSRDVVTERLNREPPTTISSESTAIDRSEERRQYEVKWSEVRGRDKVEEHRTMPGMVSAEEAPVAGADAVQHQAAVVGPDVTHEAAVQTRSSPVQKPVESARSRGGESLDGSTAAGRRAEDVSGAASIETPRVKQAELETASVGSSRAQSDPTAGAPPIGGSANGAGPDYGWLKRLLWERINRVKSYSDDAIENEWEGRVVMVVTIRSDGNIEEVRVAESSGNDSLDREAAALITRVSPLELDRALGAARVRFRVPIAFGLE
ncbi:MAG: energy transducer TonB [Nitrospiraceae bacterium]